MLQGLNKQHLPCARYHGESVHGLRGFLVPHQAAPRKPISETRRTRSSQDPSQRLIPKRYFASHEHELKPTRMNEPQANHDTEAVATALPARQRPPFHPAKSRRLCNAQFALPAAPRRQTCLTMPRWILRGNALWLTIGSLG